MAHAPRPPDPARLAARPLAGRRIAVTRAHEQAGDLTRELEALGAEVVAAPTIRIAPLADLAALRAALTRVPPYDWIVFTSQNAVQVMCDRLPEWELAPRDVARAAHGVTCAGRRCCSRALGRRVMLCPTGCAGWAHWST